MAYIVMSLQEVARLSVSSAQSSCVSAGIHSEKKCAWASPHIERLVDQCRRQRRVDTLAMQHGDNGATAPVFDGHDTWPLLGIADGMSTPRV